MSVLCPVSAVMDVTTLMEGSIATALVDYS